MVEIWARLGFLELRLPRALGAGSRSQPYGAVAAGSAVLAAAERNFVWVLRQRRVNGAYRCAGEDDRPRPFFCRHCSAALRPAEYWSMRDVVVDGHPT